MKPNISTHIWDYPWSLLIFEWVDASGKTTQAVRVANELKKQGKKVSLSGWNQSPYFSPYFQNQTQAEAKKVISPEAHLFLQVAEMLYRLERKVLPALKRGEIVILDRGMQSMHVRWRMLWLSEEQIHTGLCWFEQSIYADLCKKSHIIYLSIGTKEGVNRLMHRDKKILHTSPSGWSVLNLQRFDMMEFSPDGYRMTDKQRNRLTRDTYTKITRIYENVLWENEDVHRDDGQLHKDEVQKEIMAVLDSLI